MKYIISFILALSISFFVVGGVYKVLSNLRDVVESQNIDKKEIIERKELTIDEIKEQYMKEYQTLLLNCFQEANKMEIDKSAQECYSDILLKFNTSIEIEHKEVNINSESDFLIHIIYIIIFISLLSQLMLFFLKSSNKIAFYISEFNLNAPATLGILGTILSFAIVASMSKDGNIQALFLANFFNAVITTALGVTVYIINLFLNIYIAPRINF